MEFKLDLIGISHWSRRYATNINIASFWLWIILDSVGRCERFSSLISIDNKCEFWYCAAWLSVFVSRSFNVLWWCACFGKSTSLQERAKKQNRANIHCIAKPARQKKKNNKTSCHIDECIFFFGSHKPNKIVHYNIGNGNNDNKNCHHADLLMLFFISDLRTDLSLVSKPNHNKHQTARKQIPIFLTIHTVMNMYYHYKSIHFQKQNKSSHWIY